MLEIVKKNFEEFYTISGAILENELLLSSIAEASNQIYECIKFGGKVIVAGNGGSAADAQHFVAELMGKFQMERQGFPAIALTTNTSLLTALANDYCYDIIFAHQLKAIAQPKDIFVGISTSGNSENVFCAFEQAKQMGIKTIALLGKDGGKIKEICDTTIIVPHHRTARIQEIHILIIHSICDAVETYMMTD
ncbi:phosphoheptose isomerase [bacterium]|nr:MAG: phosphoheptose isomerase [bacterium]